jgi:glutaconate CoA-transferase, subunit A
LLVNGAAGALGRAAVQLAPVWQSIRAPENARSMAELTTVREAIADLVHDGDAVALEGFTHLIPFAAGHEVLRHGRRDLELIRMTPDVLFDQMVGAGAARKLVFSYAGNPGVGSLHRLRDAIENGWPHAVQIEEHSHAGMANRFAAGAADLPFGVLRGYRDTDLAEHTRVAWITCPFTGEELAAVPALRPDVAIVHAQEADRRGNVQLWGIPGVQKEAVLAAERSLVTVERIVERLEPRAGGVLIPGWVIDAVAEAPGGSQPSYSLGITSRDNDFYRAWDAISRDRDRFREWIGEHVLQAAAA